MANSGFRFKKFTIRQDQTAMKVGTDGVLLGAWADITGCRRILDVGTGTGLISLMLAQRTEAFIDAIEIDPEAAEQATQNVADSPWPDKINVICSSFQNFYNKPLSKYDLVVCNPPFFSNSLKAKSLTRTLAKHNDTLELGELLKGTINLLNSSGHLSIILPAESEHGMIALSKKNHLFLAKILRIRPIPGKSFKRILMDFSLSDQGLIEREMNIETGPRHQYSKEYLDLTRDYYL